MHVGALKRLQLETDLRKAIERHEFRVYYQPIVSLHTGNIVGFEALTRWQHPKGLVMPSEFISVADETGIILAINNQLVPEACRQVREWQKLVPLRSASISQCKHQPETILQADLYLQIGQVLQDCEMQPCSLSLEITETIAMADADRSAA